MTITDYRTVKKILKNNCRDTEGTLYPMVYTYQVGSSKVWLYALFTHVDFDDVGTSHLIKRYHCLAQMACLTETGKQWVKVFDDLDALGRVQC